MPGMIQWIRNLLPPLDQKDRQLRKLKQSIEGKSRKRKPFQAKIALPWYSIRRVRNQFILGLSGVIFMNWEVLKLMGRSAKFSYRLERERKEFNRQLDEEDRQWELQHGLSSGTSS